MLPRFLADPSIVKKVNRQTAAAGFIICRYVSGIDKAHTGAILTHLPNTNNRLFRGMKAKINPTVLNALNNNRAEINLCSIGLLRPIFKDI